MVFKIFRSSAGSGKTYVLTKQYLKLLLTCPAYDGCFSSQYFKDILAITFTNDAANEMKERIIWQLERFSQSDMHNPDEMLKIIYEEIEKKITLNVLIQRAKAIHKNILHNYSSLSIGTIDAFTHKIIQSFKRELHFPYHFEIMMSQNILLEEATDRFLENISDTNNQDIGKYISYFLKDKISDEKSWYIDRDIQSHGTNLFNEERYKLIKKLKYLSIKDFEKINDKIRQKIRNFEEKIKRITDEVLFVIEKQNLNASCFYQGERGIFAYFKKHALLKNDIKALQANQYVKKTINEQRWYSNKITTTEKNSIDLIKDKLSTSFEEIEKIKQNEGSTYIICKMLYGEIFSLGILNKLDVYVQAIKEEKNIVHISDFNRSINEIVINEPVPYIYERIGEKYKHLLIDEFQDTSQIQWHNLIPLVSNSLNNGYLSMVVGDCKQAIYRWRGGKSEILENLPRVSNISNYPTLIEQARVFPNAVKRISLNTNYRSHSHIIKFNNEFFRYVVENFKKNYPELAAYYTDLEQENTKKKGGQVQINLLSSQKNKATKTQIHSRRIIDIINALKKENYQYQDIAILCRSNNEGSLIAEKLLSEEISVISSESLLLTTSPVIWFIIAILQIINYTIDQHAIVRIFYFIDIYLHKQTNSLDHTEKLLTFINKLKKKEKPNPNDIIDLLNKNFGYTFDLQKSTTLSLIELIEEIIGCFDLGNIYTQQIYLQKFLDFVLQSTTGKNNNINDFLKEWEYEKKNISISNSKNSDAVKIMTIHKSKGLQFPVVIIPSIDWKKSNMRTKLWQEWNHQDFPMLKTIVLPYNKNLENTDFKLSFLKEKEEQLTDDLNTLYVAFTRSKEKLFILTESKMSSAENISTLLNKFIDERKEIISSKNLQIEQETYKVVDIYSEKLKRVNKQQEVSTHKIQIEKFLHISSKEKINFKRNTSLIAEEINLQNLVNPRFQGIFIHKAFEYINSTEDITFSVEKLINQGLIIENEKIAFEKKIWQIVQLPEIKRYFDKKNQFEIYNEKNLLIPIKEEITILRPDKIIFDKDELVIIDYKTGKENIKEHKRPINYYAGFLKKIYLKEVKKIIVYTELPSAVLV